MEDSAILRIGTHDGNFHADEILAVAILSTLFPQHTVTRTRDEAVLATMDIVVDVGGVYDPAQRRYDHHLPHPPADQHGHIYSSAGLVWLHHGKAYLRTIGIPKDSWLENQYLDLLDLVEKQIRIQWIYPIDRSDNGVAQGPTPISELVSAMRPTDPEKTRVRYSQAFFDCVSMVAHLFKRSCFHAADHVIAQARYTSGPKQILADGRIVVSEHSVRNYKAFRETPAHFVISAAREYIDSDPYFVIRSVLSPDSQLYKTPFPGELLGKRDDQLEIPGITYIHHGGYMALASTQQAAIDFCQTLLNVTED